MVRILNFKGMIPRVQPRLLPEGFAQVATNAVLETGELAPLRAPETVYTFATSKAAILRHNGAWYGWSDAGVSAAPGPIAQDRLYITGDGVPKVEYLGVQYPLALAAPESAATVAFTNAPAASVPNDPSATPTLPASGGTVPAALRIVRQPVGSISGLILITQPLIVVVDAAGLRCADDNATTVNVVISEGVSGALTGTRTLTASSGLIRFTDLAMTGDHNDDYRLRFDADGLTSAESDIVVVTQNMSDLTSTILYTHTFVTSLGEESPPAPLSAGLDWYPGLIVRLSNLSAAPSGRLITHRRIYRSVTSLSGVTDLYFVKEIPVAQLTYDHDIEVDPIAEVIPSADYDAPPDAMQGIIAMPNGMMVAFDGRELLFSEPYRPHAWPVKYRLTTDFDIVGLAAFGSSVAILTAGTPYIAQGTHPASMIMERLEVNYPCVARRGIVDLGYSVAYPSNDGLVILSSGGAVLATKNTLTREQWQAFNPASFIAGQFSGRYIASTPDLGEYAGASQWILAGRWDDEIAIDDALLMSDNRRTVTIDTTGEVPFISTSDIAAIAFANDLETGELFILEGGSEDEVKAWNAGDAMDFTWRSAILRFGGLVNFGAAQIVADTTAEAVETRVYADGVLRATLTTKNTPQRLPGGFLASEWVFEVEGAAAIYAIEFGASIEDLVNG